MARYLLKLLLLAPGGVVSWIPALSAHPAVLTTTTMRAVGSSSSQHGPRSDPLASSTSSTSSSSSSSSRSEVLKELGRYAAGAGVLSLAGACGSPLSALADNALAATKKSYFRYVPRILDAMAWYEGDLQKAIAEEDWPKVLAYFEVVNTARSDSSRPAMYQSSSSRMQRELFSPLSVWAQSMSIKGTGRVGMVLFCYRNIHASPLPWSFCHRGWVFAAWLRRRETSRPPRCLPSGLGFRRLAAMLLNKPITS
ncbi:unnamed protein product [Ectocarpus sp. 4 AP-2014]